MNLDEATGVVVDILRLDADQRDVVTMAEIDHGIAVCVAMDSRYEVGSRVHMQVVDVPLDLQNVTVMEVHHDVTAAAAAEDESIVAGAGNHGVVAAAAEQRLFAGAADQQVIALAAG